MDDPTSDPPPARCAVWPPPSLSTPRREAVTAYQDGVAALVAGAVNAETLLAEALTVDPGFALARVAMSVAGVLAGVPFRPVPTADGLSRGERQHLGVVHASFAERPDRAADLRREHLAEFPGDLLIVWLPALRPRAAA
jgi:hypothetical protein